MERPTTNQHCSIDATWLLVTCPCLMYSYTVQKSHYPPASHHASHLMLSTVADDLHVWFHFNFTLIITLAGTLAITKMSGHHHHLAGGYDLEMEHF